ncbi:PRC-barrel domain-containing protein [Crenalkalicoccus roseus]|uniref:PRC-barrel domain-containing protein n=1 Tax=Crenalkalicoccus roseus TaxID=1485588 RepID=UPI0010812875|nr:PRC-barrel domain-containing protein [Crenalkalicoccus roseus]
MRLRGLAGAALAAALLGPGAAAAQQGAPPAAARIQAQGGQQCLQELAAFGRQMEQDGYWLAGYRRHYGWGVYGARPVEPALRAPGVAPAPGTEAADPWRGLRWRMAPGQELSALFRAAAVLAQRGEGHLCHAVLTELRDIYAEYVQQLRQAGVQPGEVLSYRQQQVALARPVTEAPRSFRADAITGADVRSPRDERLGSIEDVVVHPVSGQITHVILARGGFLGLGQDHVAVPWERLRVAPAMDVFVLDVAPERLEGAPRLDPDALADAQAFERRRQEIDRYWQEERPRGG